MRINDDCALYGRLCDALRHFLERVMTKCRKANAYLYARPALFPTIARQPPPQGHSTSS